MIRVAAIVFFFFLHVACLTGQNLQFQISPSYLDPIKVEELQAAETMSHIKAGYPRDWIQDNDYISTSIISMVDGIETGSSIGKAHKLTDDQRKLLARQPVGAEIYVEVNYLSDNAISSDQEKRKVEFSLTVAPEVPAHFPDGRAGIDAYIEEAVMQKLPQHDPADLEMVSMTFVIDEEGRPTDCKMKEPTSLMMVQSLLMNAISKMPDWIPALDSEGNNVAQKFEIQLGYMVGC